MEINKLDGNKIFSSHSDNSRMFQTAEAPSNSKSSLTHSKKEETCWETFTSSLKKALDWFLSLFECCCGKRKKDDLECINPVQHFINYPETTLSYAKKDPKAFTKDLATTFLNNPKELFLSLIKLGNPPANRTKPSDYLHVFLYDQAASLIETGKLDESRPTVNFLNLTVQGNEDNLSSIKACIEDLNKELAADSDKAAASLKITQDLKAAQQWVRAPRQ